MKSDLLRVEAQTARFQGNLAEATHARARAVQDLRTLLQMDPGDSIELAVDVALDDGHSEMFSHALAIALENREELAAVAALAGSAAAASDSTFWEQLPDIEIAGGVRRAQPNPRVFPPVDEFRTDWRVGAEISWSPTDFFAARARRAAAEADVERARVSVDQLRDQVKNDVARALERTKTARALMKSARVELEAARESYRVKSVQYPAGLSTLSDLIDSESEMIASELRLLNASVQRALANEQLSRALGKN
ncbi:MAG: TolC family protein [Myxococcota bacterium]